MEEDELKYLRNSEIRYEIKNLIGSPVNPDTNSVLSRTRFTKRELVTLAAHVEANPLLPTTEELVASVKDTLDIRNDEIRQQHPNMLPFTRDELKQIYLLLNEEDFDSNHIGDVIQSEKHSGERLTNIQRKSPISSRETREYYNM